jgi:hypothetical protein
MTTPNKVKLLSDADMQVVAELTKTGSIDGIKALLVDANKAQVSVNQLYQIIGVAAIQHLAKHRNLNVLKHVIEDMSPSLNIKAMQMFFIKFAPVQLDADGETFIFDETKQWNIGLAIESHWYKQAPPAKIVPFNLDAELARIVKRAGQRLAKPVEGDNIDVDTLAKVKELATRQAVNVTVAA